jgi:AcrR family transcriptional regulator
VRRVRPGVGSATARSATARSAGSAARRSGEGSARAAGSSGALAEIQRSRLLAGAVGAIEEFGYTQATVAQITSRARISRRTFYELFGNREECLAALIEHVVALVECDLAAADLGGRPWHERVRGGLLAILAFFDREPALARLCVVETLRGGPQMLERRAQILARLASVVDEGRGERARGRECTAFTAEALVGAAFAVVHARLLRDEHEPLTQLSGELMGIIVLPYLGPAAARREQLLPVPAPAPVARRAPLRLRGGRDPLSDVPMRLTYRTTLVMACIAERPGISNREVADRADVSDQGQISKLLARLERLGLIANTGEGHAKGEPNAWRLTPLGRRVAQRLTLDAGRREEAA